MKNRTFVLIAALLTALVLIFAACEGPTGPAGPAGTPGTPGAPGGMGVMVKDATNQLIGYLVTYTSPATGNYTVYNPSAINATYPDGVFYIGKASNTLALAGWTGSGTAGTSIQTSL